MATSDEHIGVWLLLVFLASLGFGSWTESFGAGVWMFVVLMWAEGMSDNLKRRD